ncbi:MAG: hypothetical protein FWD31_05965, partial [Planctomycetaceae bacterium]|nr:hypothetical protein [Planctomycetaceae bacterium]
MWVNPDSDVLPRSQLVFPPIPIPCYMSIEITVLPDKETVSCPTGLRLHEVLARTSATSATMRKPLATPCGGNGTCGKCLVWIAPMRSDGDSCYDSMPFHSLAFHQVRACQYVVCESLYVRLSEESLLLDASQILTSHQVPDSHDEAAVPLTLAYLAADALANLQQDLTDQGGIRAKTPGNTVGQYVVAVDIGTTTIVAELLFVQTRSVDSMTEVSSNLTRSCGVQACRNPQARFGDDIISRIQYACESKENADRLRLVVVDAINDLIRSLADNVKKTNLPKPIPELVFPEQITLVVIAGNTTMQQLFAMYDVQALGRSPFEP